MKEDPGRRTAPAAGKSREQRAAATAMEEARTIEQAYGSPEIVQQRLETLKVVQARSGEQVLDAGCGPGLLTAELARQVGDRGRVVGVDRNAGMLELARRRCRDMPQVSFIESSVGEMAEQDDVFDAVVCAQVLLYVDDVPATIGELKRVLKPGGRLVIIETDWRSCVLGSDDFELTETMIRAWDDSVPSPNLPVRLISVLRSLNFTAVRAQVIPVLDTNPAPGGYSEDIVHWFRDKAVDQGKVDPARASGWLDDLRRRAARGDYFFCVNRFLFSAVK